MTELGDAYLLERNLQCALYFEHGRRGLIKNYPNLKEHVRSVIFQTIVLDLETVFRKDVEGSLYIFVPDIRSWLSGADLGFMNAAVLNWMGCLKKMMLSKFVLCIFTAMVERAIEVIDTSEENEARSWYEFMRYFIRSAPTDWSDDTKPIYGVDPYSLSRHLHRAIGLGPESMRDELWSKLINVEKLLKDPFGYD